jgi:hypothetical protein
LSTGLALLMGWWPARPWDWLRESLWEWRSAKVPGWCRVLGLSASARLCQRPGWESVREFQQECLERLDAIHPDLPQSNRFGSAPDQRSMVQSQNRFLDSFPSLDLLSLRFETKIAADFDCLPGLKFDCLPGSNDSFRPEFRSPLRRLNFRCSVELS